MKRVAFCTLGCKVNQYETNAMEQAFIKAGYEIVNFDRQADVYVINTCTVTNMSDKKSRQMIRKAKQLNNNSIVVAVGCYAQVSKDKLEDIEEVDLILGNNEKKDIVKYIEDFQKEKIVHLEDVLHQKEFIDFGTTIHMEKTRAVIKVQDGCDRFCSYCIIPYARGRVRSRKLENVVEEVKRLASNGFKEIVLTGIHLSSYGVDCDDNLLNLIKKVHEIDGIERIRLGSLEPRLITEEFVKEISGLKKVCPHFHLSLQSGCDETLKRMNRKYTTEEYAKGCEILRKYYEHPAITTDVIDGFPGETDEEFETTAHYLRYIHFYEMHIFKYSNR